MASGHSTPARESKGERAAVLVAMSMPVAAVLFGFAHVYRAALGSWRLVVALVVLAVASMAFHATLALLLRWWRPSTPLLDWAWLTRPVAGICAGALAAAVAELPPFHGATFGLVIGIMLWLPELLPISERLRSEAEVRTAGQDGER